MTTRASTALATRRRALRSRRMRAIAGQARARAIARRRRESGDGMQHGDIVTWLQNYDGPRFHAIVADPPYGLEFMGADWDKPKPSGAYIRDPQGGRGVDGFGRWKSSRPDAYHAGNDYQAWVTEWASLMLNVVYPGAVLAMFGGTRTWHRLACGLEDAGWEIFDTIGCWMYGSGFPKSHNLPNGRGTALKPAHEPMVCARKPLNFVPYDGILTETNELLGGMLCLSLLSVNDAEQVSQFSPSGLQTGDVSASVATLAALLHGAKSGALFGKMDTFNSPETVKMCLSIAKLWNSILAGVYTDESTYTTSTASSLITALKICKSLILENMPASITSDVIRILGLPFAVLNAGKNLTAAETSTSIIQKHFAIALATLKTELDTTNASTAVNLLRAIIPSVDSVLRHALTELPAPSAEKRALNYLPVILARAPRQGNTYAKLATDYGTAALNIDGCRIAHDEPLKLTERTTPRYAGVMNGGVVGGASSVVASADPLGRWPANLIFDAESAALLDEQSGFLHGAGNKQDSYMTGGTHIYNGGWGERYNNPNYHDNSGGGASRFFYTAKADSAERQIPYGDEWRRSTHPTLKPLDLTRWLCSLLLPPSAIGERRLLIPFAGVCSEMIGAHLAGWDSVTGVEQDAEYVEQGRKRLAWWREQTSYEAGLERIKSIGRGDAEDTEREQGGQLPLFADVA